MPRLISKITEDRLKAVVEAHRKNPSDRLLKCEDNIYLRLYKTKTISWFYYCETSETKSKRYYKIADFEELSTLKAAREYLKKNKKSIINNQIPRRRISNFTEKVDKNCFGMIAIKWLSTKTKRVRYDNIRKSVEYLNPFYEYNFDELTVPLVKRILKENTNITPYKMQEVIRSLCNIADLAIEDGIIENHRFDVLKKSPEFEKHKKGAGYKFTPISNFNELFTRISQLPKEIRLFFLLHAQLCLRPGETRQLKFSYFNVKEKILYVPGTLLKVKRSEPFRIPLSKQVIKLLDHIRDFRLEEGQSEFLFTSIRDKNKALREVDLSAPLKLIAGDLMQPHGFRKAARSFFAEKNIPIEVAAKCLDHELVLGSADHIYQKSDLLDLRKPVMQLLSDAIEEQLPESIKIDIQ